jgi:UPF0755 protein
MIKGMPRVLVAFSFLAIVLAALAAAGRVAWFAFTPADPAGSEARVIEIRRGVGAGEIAASLASQSVITDARLFLWVGRISRQTAKVKAGEYQVSARMTPLEVWAVITSGVSLRHPVTIREGQNAYEIADDLEAKRLAGRARFLALCKDARFIATLGLGDGPPAFLEGYLFPDTYHFDRTQTEEDMIRQMVRRFVAAWTDREEAEARAIGLSRHQVITLASIIEKETGASNERALISSVFHNRLRRRMRLQSDPTTIYGIWERYKGNIRREDLQAVNPYNTYVIPALPVGPIGNPGIESIRAALHPATSDYLFFVSHNDGTHEFTRTFKDHEAAVRKFQLDRRAREGKSWRDLRRAADRR